MFRHYKLLLLVMLFEVFVITSDFETPELPKPDTYSEVVVLEPGPIVDKSENEEMVAMNPIETVAEKISSKYLGINYPEALNLVNIVFREAPANGFEPEFVLGVIASESSFKRFVVSHAGAKGYMQVIPKWHQNRIKGRNIFETAVNVEAGTGFLRECIDRKGSVIEGLACYNGSDSYASKMRYVNKVTRNSMAMGQMLASL